jgi:PhzF family phenazine biosynthesis protein
MPDTLRFCLVDAFAEQPYRGNPAGVVFDADGLSPAQMQQIAGEINVSETVFITRANDLHRPTQIRWFTPRTEVSFCGHATLAAAHGLLEAGCLGDLLARPDASILFDSAAGPLRLQPERLPEPSERAIWWLEMPDPGLKPDHTNPIRTCELLGLTVEDLDPALPAMRTRDNDLIYMVRDWQTLMDMRPRLDELAEWSRRNAIRGFCVATTATLSDAVNVHSRFFAPAVGVNEDPVTGSVHGPLAAYLVANGLVGRAGNRSALFCAQGTSEGRGGLVRALVESMPQGYRVCIGGQCFTTLTGDLLVPSAA